MHRLANVLAWCTGQVSHTYRVDMGKLGLARKGQKLKRKPDETQKPKKAAKAPKLQGVQSTVRYTDRRAA